MNSSKKSRKTSGGLSEDEKAAMKDRLEELKAGKANTEEAVLAKIAEMPEPDRGMATRLHKLIMSTAPDLKPRLWYGMPAYAKDDKVVCYFQTASRFKSRYATLGFNDTANLDEGAMWPTSFALRELSAAEEAKIAELVKKAVSSSAPRSGLSSPSRKRPSGAGES